MAIFPCWYNMNLLPFSSFVYSVNIQDNLIQFLPVCITRMLITLVAMVAMLITWWILANITGTYQWNFMRAFSVLLALCSVKKQVGSCGTISVQLWYLCYVLKWSVTLLTHLCLDKIAAISPTIFPDAFSWMKNFVFWLKFDWSLFLRVQLTITQHWFR